MPSDQEIQARRRAFSTYTQDQLVAEMHKHIPNSVRHIAAKLVLEDRKNQTDEGFREESRRQHAHAIAVALRSNRIAWIAIGFSAFSLVLWALNVFGLFGPH